MTLDEYECKTGLLERTASNSTDEQRDPSGERGSDAGLDEFIDPDSIDEFIDPDASDEFYESETPDGDAPAVVTAPDSSSPRGASAGVGWLRRGFERLTQRLAPVFAIALLVVAMDGTWTFASAAPPPNGVVLHPQLDEPERP